MIERFEVGKKYRWIGGNEIPLDWNPDGMSFLLDGQPYKVTKARGMLAAFYGHPNPHIKDRMWGFLGCESNFEEVTE